MKMVRLGVIGTGCMGACHADQVLEGKVQRCGLTALCDAQADRMAKYGDGIAKFTDSRRLIRSGLVDAVLIATPHFEHAPVSIDALKQGLHVLVEKPIAVQKADCLRMIAAHKNRKQVFGVMFNQRTDPHYSKVRKLVRSGTLGKLMRVSWTITDWFRTQFYYESSPWRATWAGEGGGVLLNQAPHNLDLLQWICGMPKSVTAFCSFGKRHKIEVEDEVTAYFEYKNGATGVFMTSTGEAPGTNRLEIACEHGRVVVEHGEIGLVKNEMSCVKFCAKSRQMFAVPPVRHISIPVDGNGGQHVEIKQNFVDAILDGAPLLAPAREGIHSVELANAMLYSSLTGRRVDLPLNAVMFEALLRSLIRKSRFSRKTARKSVRKDPSVFKRVRPGLRCE